MMYEVVEENSNGGERYYAVHNRLKYPVTNSIAYLYAGQCLVVLHDCWPHTNW